VSWNVNWRATPAERRRQLEHITRWQPDLLLLQEVNARTLAAFETSFDWAVFALGPNPNDRHWRMRYGTAVLGRGHVELRNAHSVAPTWFALPEDASWKANRFTRRATCAEVRVANMAEFVVMSLHASPAAGAIAEHKPWFHARIGAWLAEVDAPWLFGIDANTPGIDHPDQDRNEWCWPRTDAHPGEDELLGSLATHRGRDLLRDWLGRNSEELERIVAMRPRGPLAVSYRLRSGPVRYDHLWATEEFGVEEIRYDQESFDASDHAAIVADLAFAHRGEVRS
jgi:hypothetical protein